jgi:hypothetical protein
MIPRAGGLACHWLCGELLDVSASLFLTSRIDGNETPSFRAWTRTFAIFRLKITAARAADTPSDAICLRRSFCSSVQPVRVALFISKDWARRRRISLARRAGCSPIGPLRSSLDQCRRTGYSDA